MARTPRRINPGRSLMMPSVYPAWKWFEKQDGIQSLQKDNKDAPEFYNIYLERPKGDADGYDLVVVDAMHKANYASRICHSCRPNCEAKLFAFKFDAAK
ncbi:histone-lysine N-methyltransferase ATXR3 [Tripterygium wilfordii]|uniref:Histone-lysine N-methyltransferase ATXR3 n=1 Tax=Tripterygium wilfordii TaxID=458696 RepID=A0A7J7D6F0_TRIWF|nr:histone-lysine N-methyltransferase ATXR3 [Tripterygium wilfordii]